MANGYALPILQHIQAMLGTNPARKIPTLGFLQMVLSQMDDSVKWSQQYVGGHETTLKVKYRKRPLESEVSDTENGCEVAATPSFEEFTVPGLLHREKAFYLSNAQIKQYTKDASEFVKLNAADNTVELQKETQVMKEVYDLMIEYGGAVLRSVDTALITQMATNFGTNVVTDSNAARALTFDIGSVAMSGALVQLLSDIRENEMSDNIAMVGNGPFSNMDLVKKFFSTMPNNQGLNMSAFTNAFPQIWHDKKTASIWGPNQIGVFEKGSVHLLTRNKYIGNFAQKLANSTFFSMALPIAEFNGGSTQFLDRLMFDIQIREIDCPTELLVNDVPTTVSEGVQVIIKKDFSLFTVPEMYNEADELYGTNGTLRYTLTATA